MDNLVSFKIRVTRSGEQFVAGIGMSSPNIFTTMLEIERALQMSGIIVETGVSHETGEIGGKNEILQSLLIHNESRKSVEKQRLESELMPNDIFIHVKSGKKYFAKDVYGYEGCIFLKPVEKDL